MKCNDRLFVIYFLFAMYMYVYHIKGYTAVYVLSKCKRDLYQGDSSQAEDKYLRRAFREAIKEL